MCTNTKRGGTRENRNYRRFKELSHEEIRSSLEKARSIYQALLELGIAPSSGNYARAREFIAESGIDVSHMTGQGWNRGDTLGLRILNTIPLERILVKDSTYTCTSLLRKRLISAGLKKQACECCGLDEWNGRKISFELDHINGDRFDHRLGNLQLLYPNCHAQTPTHRGKNIGSGIYS